MRNRLKTLFSALVMAAFACQAVAANACVTALQLQHGANVGSLEANASLKAHTSHGDLGQATDHSDPLHDPDCANDCDAQSAFVDGRVTLSVLVQDELSKSRSSTASLVATQLHMPNMGQVRAPPPASDLYLVIPTSLLSQQTLLLI